MSDSIWVDEPTEEGWWAVRLLNSKAPEDMSFEYFANDDNRQMADRDGTTMDNYSPSCRFIFIGKLAQELFNREIEYV
mgnify:CR=1 FL=1